MGVGVSRGCGAVEESSDVRGAVCADVACGAGDGGGGSGLQDGAVERDGFGAAEGVDVVADGDGAGGFAEDGDVGGVAAEEADVGFYPFHADALVVEAGVEGVGGGEGGG